uniref:Aquaporin n=2 Tax=Panagrolaimus sp. JU765 TaxID=591449 RepID=A0AC34RR12_9BILA
MAPIPLVERFRAKTTVKNELLRAAFGEFTGTFILVLIINSVCAQQIIPRSGGNALINVNWGVGLGIAFGIAVTAKASGGHINPAVTIAMLAVKKIKVLNALAYIAAQYLGAFLGAAVTFAVYYDAIKAFDAGTRSVIGTRATAHIFASYPAPHLSTCGGFVDQVVATAVFLFLIAHIIDRRNGYPTWTYGPLIGLVFVMIGTAFAYNCGYPLNPARDFSPRLFTLIAGYGGETFSYRGYNWFWVPIVGPIIGGILGVYLYQFLLGNHYPAETTEYEVVATREMQPLTTEKNGAEEA